MPPLERVLLALAVLLAYALLCRISTGLRRSRAALADGSATAGEDTRAPMLVAYASQSGTAAAIARRSAEALRSAWPVRLLPLDRVDDAVLATTQRALFVASTYGDGEPPDNGAGFARRYLHGLGGPDLSHLQFAVLALGDRVYRQFCAFGRNLHEGLCRQGATPLFEPLEAGRDDLEHENGAISLWHEHLARLQGRDGGKRPASASSHAASTATPWKSWRLRSRRCTNAESTAAAVYHVCLAPADDAPLPSWQAGDIIEIAPGNPPSRCAEALRELELAGGTAITIDGETRTLSHWLSRRRLPDADECLPAGAAADPAAWLSALPLLRVREYSVASVPEDGDLELLIRRRHTPDGGLGIGSGWLTAHLRHEDIVQARIRENSQFHGPEPQRPMLLIGNGTGLAGLRAHLRERLHRSANANWLFYGERSRRHDFHFADEIAAWQRSGHLLRVDVAFSDCDAQRVRVQDRLLEHADDVRRWIADGAAVYVCGSRERMAASVEDALQNILGEAGLDRLRQLGLYRRDVY